MGGLALGISADFIFLLIAMCYFFTDAYENYKHQALWKCLTLIISVTWLVVVVTSTFRG